MITRIIRLNNSPRINQVNNNNPNSQVNFQSNPDEFIKSSGDIYSVAAKILKEIGTKDIVTESFANPDPGLVFDNLFLIVKKIGSKMNLSVCYVKQCQDDVTGKIIPEYSGRVPIATKLSESELNALVTGKNFKSMIVEKLKPESDKILFNETKRMDD